MAFGYINGDKLVLFTFRRDLGSGKGKRGSWWALIAFDAMADMREELQYGVNASIRRRQVGLNHDQTVVPSIINKEPARRVSPQRFLYAQSSWAP
jgi:hypothetical protein